MHVDKDRRTALAIAPVVEVVCPKETAPTRLSCVVVAAAHFCCQLAPFYDGTGNKLYF